MVVINKGRLGKSGGKVYSGMEYTDELSLYVLLYFSTSRLLLLLLLQVEFHLGVFLRSCLRPPPPVSSVNKDTSASCAPFSSCSSSPRLQGGFYTLPACRTPTPLSGQSGGLLVGSLVTELTDADSSVPLLHKPTSRLGLISPPVASYPREMLLLLGISRVALCLVCISEQPTSCGVSSSELLNVLLTWHVLGRSS